MKNTNEFLEKFIKIETLLKAENTDEYNFYQVLKRYIKENPNFKKYEDDLFLCKRIRNLIVHEYNAANFIEFSDDCLKTLDNALAYIERPQYAISYATKKENIYKASINSFVDAVMVKMKERGFSYIPILDSKGTLIGVFSETAIFNYLVEHKDISIDKDLKFIDFKKYIKMENQKADYFLFRSIDLTLAEAIKLFDQKNNFKQTLKMIFLTKTGLGSEPILGILTPYDVLKSY